MNIEESMKAAIAAAFKQCYKHNIPISAITLQPTRKGFKGNYTLLTFPYAKISKVSPVATAQVLGAHLKTHCQIIDDFNVCKGFLNLVLTPTCWVSIFMQIYRQKKFGIMPARGEKVMVEYSSPNTNKPLHLGHLRNNFLGWSISKILEASGYEVMRTNLINDRGIHICKSMVAYRLFGNDELPSKHLKGDKLAGKYYVKFEAVFRQQVATLLQNLTSKYPKKDKKALQTIAEKSAPILKKAEKTLQKWENGDTETIALWQKMNNWVYEGFAKSYALMGVAFDKQYYESKTYLLGKNIVAEGLASKVFFQKADGSVWVDLTAEGLDEKLLLRANGTSVYVTQDLGTADLKYHDFPMKKSIYVVGNEQDYHFEVLKHIMKKLGRSYAQGIYHLSYGMVELPSGKMKSRQGRVVDADDLIYEMLNKAKSRTKALGKIETFSGEAANRLYHTLALGALKYYLLRVDPKKKILFDPDESIDFQGNTGVYIQYNYAKICAIVRRADEENICYTVACFQQLDQLTTIEVEMVQNISLFPKKLEEATTHYAPSLIAHYAYDLSKCYSKFYVKLPIFSEKNQHKLAFRIAISQKVAEVIKTCLYLLGIAAPSRM